MDPVARHSAVSTAPRNRQETAAHAQIGNRGNRKETAAKPPRNRSAARPRNRETAALESPQTVSLARARGHAHRRCGCAQASLSPSASLRPALPVEISRGLIAALPANAPTIRQAQQGIEPDSRPAKPPVSLTWKGLHPHARNINRLTCGAEHCGESCSAKHRNDLSHSNDPEHLRFQVRKVQVFRCLALTHERKNLAAAADRSICRGFARPSVLHSGATGVKNAANDDVIARWHTTFRTLGTNWDGSMPPGVSTASSSARPAPGQNRRRGPSLLFGAHRRAFEHLGRQIFLKPKLRMTVRCWLSRTH